VNLGQAEATATVKQRKEMKNLIGKFIRWALEDPKGSVPGILAAVDRTSETTPSFRLGVMKAMNGRVLEVATFKHNPHGPDWTTEMFIVPEDQTLTQALTTLLILKGLNT